MSRNKMVEEYFNSLGIIDIDNIDDFWDNLFDKYDEDFCMKLMDAMDERANGSTTGKIYTLKNKTLDRSLEFTTYSKDLYKGYLNEIIDLNLKPKRILDIACDNGIVACFYGILYPEAEILGVDISGNAIKCAKELAEKLGLNNVKFEQLDIKKLNKVCKDIQFDLITSVRSLKEIYNINDEIRVWSLKEVEELMVVKKQIFSISKLAEYLSDNGLFITFERLACYEQEIYFNNLFNKAGLVLNERISCKIAFQELGDKQTMPLFIYQKGESNKSSYDLVLNYFVDDKDTLNYERFINSDNKELEIGIQINFIDGSGKMRYELWHKEGKLIYLLYSNTGYRKYSVCDTSEKDAIRQKINEEKEMKLAFGQKVYEYTTIDEREKIK